MLIKKSITIKKHRTSLSLEKEFWDPIFAETDFIDFLKKQYSIGHQSLVEMDEIVVEE